MYLPAVVALLMSLPAGAMIRPCEGSDRELSP